MVELIKLIDCIPINEEWNPGRNCGETHMRKELMEEGSVPFASHLAHSRDTVVKNACKTKEYVGIEVHRIQNVIST